MIPSQIHRRDGGGVGGQVHPTALPRTQAPTADGRQKPGPDVHTALAGLVAHRYLFGPQRGAAPDGCIPSLTWPDVRRHVETTL